MQLYTNSEGGNGGGGGAGEAANARGASQQQQQQQQQPQQQQQQHNRHPTATTTADRNSQSPFEHAFAQHANPPAKADQAAGQQQTTSTTPGKRNFLFPSFCPSLWYSPTTACCFLQNVGTLSTPQKKRSLEQQSGGGSGDGSPVRSLLISSFKVLSRTVSPSQVG